MTASLGCEQKGLSIAWMLLHDVKYAGPHSIWNKIEDDQLRPALDIRLPLGSINPLRSCRTYAHVPLMDATDGVQFKRLESLLEQAVRSPARRPAAVPATATSPAVGAATPTAAPASAPAQVPSPNNMQGMAPNRCKRDLQI